MEAPLYRVKLQAGLRRRVPDVLHNTFFALNIKSNFTVTKSSCSLKSDVVAVAKKFFGSENVKIFAWNLYNNEQKPSGNYVQLIHCDDTYYLQPTDVLMINNSGLALIYSHPESKVIPLCSAGPSEIIIKIGKTAHPYNFFAASISTYYDIGIFDYHLPRVEPQTLLPVVEIINQKFYKTRDVTGLEVFIIEEGMPLLPPPLLPLMSSMNYFYYGDISPDASGSFVKFVPNDVPIEDWEPNFELDLRIKTPLEELSFLGPEIDDDE